jgi:NAD(P)-dependent dehydrogenase (short-subunit alcohol dehydrogenase family)
MKAHDLFDLSGEVALVTGASGGLGARFAAVLAANGARVVLAARRGPELAGEVGAIRAAGGEALAVEADATRPEELARAFDRAEEAFGTVTVLVSNAGIAPVHRLIDVTPEQWQAVMRLNLDAVLWGAQEAARRMIAAGRGGAIVNIASILGFGVARGVGAYATSKAAVVQLTRALALELAPKSIRVNAIAPGYIVTDINRDWLASPTGAAMVEKIPLRRFGEPSDLDGVLLLLASGAGRFMTGETVVADGGHVLPL